jgi:hypothetical protein
MSQSTKSTKSVSKLAQAMREAYFAPVVVACDDEPNDVDVVLARSAAIRAARGADVMSYDQFVELFHAQYRASQRAQELTGVVIHYTDLHIAQFVAEHGVAAELVEQYFAQLSKGFFTVRHAGRQMFEWIY